MIIVNGKRFKKAQVIARGKTYRFDLQPYSLTVTAKEYDFMTGWTFSVNCEVYTVTYSPTEIRERLNAGTIYEQIGA